MELVYILFALGFVLLIFGAKWLVEGAVSLGIRAKLSPLVIGLTVVAFGTSLPELIINVFASLKGSSGLAIGNVLGSNIMNIFFILGITAILFPINVERISIRRDLPVGVFATIILFLVANDFFLDKANIITLIDGIALLIVFVMYIYVAFRGDKPFEEERKIDQQLPDSWLKTIFLLLIGIIGLYYGGDWVSEGALAIAKAAGISESAVGLTLVAAATSLPELATSVIAALKKNVGIVMGNILGSNIINILVVLGVSAIIHPLQFESALNIQIGILMLANLGLLALILIGKGLHISRKEGIILFVIYIAFLYYSITYS